MKVTKDEIDDLIDAEYYHVVPATTVTICVLTLVNGFSVVGHSACIDPGNFDAEMGRSIAKESAFYQIWALEGYARKSGASQ